MQTSRNQIDSVLSPCDRSMTTETLETGRRPFRQPPAFVGAGQGLGRLVDRDSNRAPHIFPPASL